MAQTNVDDEGASVSLIISQIASHIKYPKECSKYEVAGSVFLSFVIDAEGKLYDIVADKVRITNIGNSDFNKLTADEQEKSKTAFAKLFFNASVKALRSVDRDVWIKVDNGRGRIKMTVPLTFRLQ